jgi:galactose mutarotase-like enzyme
VVVDSCDGGKITSMVACDREWLEASTSRDPAGPYAGGGGWDECAPTVGACTLADGTQLFDHGDAWRRPWQVLESTASVLSMQVDLESVGVTLRRSIRPTDDGLVLEYEANTRSPHGVPLLWCAHPLFRAPEGTRIVAPDIDYVEHFPRRMHRTRLQRDGVIEALPRGGALKLFAHSTTVESAGIEHPDGARLTLSWDTSLLTGLGLYWDRGLFNGSPLVGVEPSTGSNDLADEVYDALPIVRSETPLTWWVRITVSKFR